LVSNLVENAGGETFYTLAVWDCTFGEFRFHRSEEEELTWRWIWTMIRMWHLFDFSSVNTIGWDPGTMRVCIVPIGVKIFEGFSSRKMMEYCQAIWLRNHHKGTQNYQ
jgi:hypothetical protein